MTDITQQAAAQAEFVQGLPAAQSFEGIGPAINSAFAAASERLHVEVVKLTDPRDDTEAFAVRSQHGLAPIEPNIFDRFRSKPLHRAGLATHTRLDSFIAHVNRFKADHSAVFAVDDPARPSLTAIFDYHPEGSSNSETNALRHKATYAFPLSEEWKAWLENDAKSMPMQDFAQFLEDRIVDVVADAKPTSPAAIDFVGKTGGSIASPSKLIEISRGLQVNESSQFREARNLTSGEAEILFNTTHTDAAGNKLVLPSLFMICVPVFARSPDYWQILVRFRYRKSGGSIVFWYELWRADLVFEEAFSGALQQVAQETGLPLFVGTAEG